MEYVAILALGLIDWYSHYGWFYLRHWRASKIYQFFSKNWKARKITKRKT